MRTLWIIVTTLSRTANTGRVIPGSAAVHSFIAGCSACRVLQRRLAIVVVAVPICDPLPDISVHVEKTEGIRLIGSYRCGSFKERTFFARTVRLRSFAVCLSTV